MWYNIILYNYSIFCLHINKKSIKYNDFFCKYFQDVSHWMNKNWKPLNKDNFFVSQSHYMLKCISKDITTELE